MNFYITADRIGTPTGGGTVTYYENEALKSLSDRKNHVEVVVDRSLPPFECDDDTAKGMAEIEWDSEQAWPDGRETGLRLAHFYAGTFSHTIEFLQSRSCKVSYTAAAHSVEESRKEHELLGIPYDYPHLTDPGLLERYLVGYRRADQLIVPSLHSRETMRAFGCHQPITVIPHGHVPPGGEWQRPPEPFTVGYLGAIGPDKGLIYLLQAWKLLNYKDDSKLILAGRFSQEPFVVGLIQKVFGHAMPFPFSPRVPNVTVELRGWVDNISDFYNGVSVYCQPSVTEGFGIEVLEAMAHGRPVVCSTGAGACDLVTQGVGLTTKPRDVIGLAAMIDYYKKMPDKIVQHGQKGREKSKAYTWDKIQQQYVQVWKEMME